MPVPAIIAALWPFIAAAGTGAAAYGGGRALQRAIEGPKDKNGNRSKNKGISSDQPAPNYSQVISGGQGDTPQTILQNLGNEGSNLLFNQYKPSQSELMNLLGVLGAEGLLGNDFSFEPIENQARTNFAQQTIPSIAERFSALGAQKSSAFGQTLGAAGAGLESDLASQKQLYNLQRQGLFQNLAGMGLMPQFQSIFSPKQASFGQSLATSIAGPAAAATIGVGGQYLINKYGQPTKNPAEAVNAANTARPANATVAPVPFNPNNNNMQIGRNGMPLNPAVQNTLNQIGR